MSLKLKKRITANPCTFSNKQLYRTKIGETKVSQNIHSSKKKKIPAPKATIPLLTQLLH